ncbi:MAG: MFS transporter [Anaerolineae bacterium]|nr:MFS transporter [Anaerolineae bacterium]
MLAALLLFSASMALVSLWPTYPALFVALLLASVAKHLFDPSMQAYIGDRVQYTRRGLAIAITELSWSGAFLLAIPLLGWLIARTDSWRSPFPLLALAGLGALILVWRVLPADEPLTARRPSLAQGARIVLAHPTALAGLGVSMLISMGNETIGIVYGAWMEDAFGLQVAALGAASAVIGLAELGGESLVAGVVDRVGKRRAVAAGIALNAGHACCCPRWRSA